MSTIAHRRPARAEAEHRGLPNSAITDTGVNAGTNSGKSDGGETCAKCFELKLIAGIHEV